MPVLPAKPRRLRRDVPGHGAASPAQWAGPARRFRPSSLPPAATASREAVAGSGTAETESLAVTAAVSDSNPALL